MPVSKTLLPTTLVGSYAQPDWLINRDMLSKRMPPRVRASELWRVPLEWLEQAQDDATLLQLLDEGLKSGKRLAIRSGAERDPGDTVIAHDAAPQRVVEIEHQAFPGEAARAGDHARCRVGHQSRGVERESVARVEPVARVAPTPFAVEACNVVEVENHDARRRRGGERGIVAAQQRPACDLLAIVCDGLRAGTRTGAGELRPPG